MRFLVMCVLMVFSTSAFAVPVHKVCKNGDMERKVVVESAAAPCAVEYVKVTEKKPAKVIYSAKSSLDYCVSKANAFVAKLSKQGWKCLDQ